MHCEHGELNILKIDNLKSSARTTKNEASDFLIKRTPQFVVGLIRFENTLAKGV
jgi:hypothetical protein